MRTTAAVLWEPGGTWEVTDVELSPPKAGEVLIELAASGLCHSDEHLVTGDLPAVLPMVGGHEGAGRVAELGPGVTDLAVGDPVVTTFLPSCGRCPCCARGLPNLCDDGAGATLGPQLDGTYRVHAADGTELGQMCLLGTFARHTVVPVRSVVRIDEGFPLELAALLGCGVTTGFGSAVHTAELRAGDTAVVVGVGGVGANAVQGARIAGCRYVVAVDPVEFKRDSARELGATHVASSVDEAWGIVSELTRGRMADAAILCTGIAAGADLQPALQLVGKRGRVVVTALANATDETASLSLLDLTLYEKQIRGALFGSASARYELPRLVEMHNTGQLKLRELVTTEYSLEQINTGYEDMRAGRTIRGLIRY
ncbi:NDMA-dependent alcohol dehydrogenase [Pseudonocardia nematodicida]|uniref:NDMA-dependent alcohol dehydrogenase n=1 Tax=Pseudonocardia nematodicida TaxID=1206997 RepID=A0ABV1K8I6_9PSEU